MSSSESRDESSPLIPRPEHQSLGPMGVLKNLTGTPTSRVGQTSCAFGAGVIFALAHMIFVLALVVSEVRKPVGRAMTYVDFMPGLISLDGYIVLYFVSKETLRFRELEGQVSALNRAIVRKAKLLTYLGVFLMISALIASGVLITLKYYPDKSDTWYGWAVFAQTDLLTLSAAALWISQSDEGNSSRYNLLL